MIELKRQIDHLFGQDNVQPRKHEDKLAIILGMVESGKLHFNSLLK
jgi:hypothetical protein